MTTLRDILAEIERETPDTLLDDGGDNWDATNLLESLEDSELNHEAARNEYGHICLVNEQGYLIEPAAFKPVKEN